MNKIKWYCKTTLVLSPKVLTNLIVKIFYFRSELVLKVVSLACFHFYPNLSRVATIRIRAQDVHDVNFRIRKIRINGVI